MKRVREFTLMKKIVLILLLAVSAVYLGTIWQRQLFFPDETRYAEIAREMLASGDFVKPSLCGLDYYENPVMGHWLNALSTRIFGEAKGTVRFMPALCSLLGALFIGLFVHRGRTGRELDQYIVPLWFLTFAFVYVTGTYGVSDAQFSMFVTASLCCFYFAFTEEKRHLTILFLAFSGIAAGCAFLTRGFSGIVLPAAAAAGFLIWQKDWKKLFTCWLIPLVFAAAVILPWATAIHRSDPDFWRYFIGVEYFGDISFSILLLPVLLLPAAVFAAAVYRGFRGEFKTVFQSGSMLNFALCATLPPLIVLALGGRKIVCILPCLPWAAVIWHEGVMRYLERPGKSRKCWDLPLNILLTILAAAGAVLFLYEQVIIWGKLPSRYLLYYKGEPYFLACIAAVAAAVMWKVSVRNDEPMRKICAFFAGMLFLMVAGHVSIPFRIWGRMAPAEPFQQHVLPLLAGRPDVIIAADKNFLPYACYKLKRTDIKLIGSPGGLDYGLSKSPGSGRYPTREELIQLIREGKPVVIITSSNDLLHGLPVPRGKLTDRRFGVLVSRYNL